MRRVIRACANTNTRQANAHSARSTLQCWDDPTKKESIRLSCTSPINICVQPRGGWWWRSMSETAVAGRLERSKRKVHSTATSSKYSFRSDHPGLHRLKLVCRGCIIIVSATHLAGSASGQNERHRIMFFRLFNLLLRASTRATRS